MRWRCSLPVIAGVLLINLSLPANAEPRRIRVGVYDNKPLVYMGTEGPEGLFIDVLQAVAQNQGWEPDYWYDSWDTLFQAILAGELDLLPVVAFNEQRAQNLQFSRHTLVANWGEIYTRPGLGTSSITDLQDQSIAYMENDTHSLFFRRLLDTLVVGHTAVMVESYTDMLKALEDGRADAGVFNHIQASLTAGDKTIQVTPIVFNPIEIRFAAPKGDPARLLPPLDSYIARIQNGDQKEYLQLTQNWLGVGQKAKVPRWVWALVVAILAGSILVMGLNLWLRRMVQKRTAALQVSNRALKESEARYRTILSSAMDGFLLSDQEGTVIEANDIYCTMSGYSPDELVGLHASELDAEESRELILEKIGRIPETGSERFESRHRRKDGSTYDVELSIQYQTGTAEHFVTFIRDISEQKRLDKERQQAEEALAKQAEYQRAIFDCSPLAMFNMDKEGRVQSCNLAAEQLFGWNTTELQGQRLPTIPADKVDEFSQLRGLLLSGHNIEGVELVRQRKDGTSIPVSLWSAPVYDADKQISGIITYYEDISKRKAIEEQLRSNLAEKQVLLREIHHRVKNNLSVISSLLNLQSATITNPEQAIEAFRNSRDRILAMALVHMELYESGNFARIDMGTYIGNLTRHIALVNENSRQINLVSHVETLLLDLEVAVPCGLILNELITNAYKYAARDDQKVNIEVSMDQDKDGLFSILVTDNGPGLPADYEKSGSLGLTLVRLLVGQIDGTMDMESSADGTMIRISFPDPSLV